MTIKAYIQNKFKPFQLVLSEADLVEFALNYQLDMDAELTGSNLKTVGIAICKSIPSLLARPTSVSEGGFSVSYDTQGIRDFYAFLCKEYDIPNKLNPKPTVTFY